MNVKNQIKESLIPGQYIMSDGDIYQEIEDGILLNNQIQEKFQIISQCTHHDLVCGENIEMQLQKL
jgi:hypothetical protein